jgi:hypothetical protein
MGMFDNVILLGEGASLVRCAHGHAQQDLQTKSLDCLMDDYYVHDRVLYHAMRGGEAPVAKPRRLEDGKLRLRWERDALRVTLTGEIVAYTQCHDCDPIVYESESSFAGHISDRRVWVEYELQFRDGRLVEAVALSAKSREETREEMLRDGVAVLPDEDRVARRRLEMLRKKSVSG